MRWILSNLQTLPNNIRTDARWQSATGTVEKMIALIDRTGLPLDTKLGIQLRGAGNGALVIDTVIPGGLNYLMFYRERLRLRRSRRP